MTMRRVGPYNNKFETRRLEDILLINEPLPLDRRMWANTINDLLIYKRDNTVPLIWYKGLVVICAEDGNTYVWTEYNSEHITPDSDGYTYPEGYVKYGYNYSGKKFIWALANIAGSQSVIDVDGRTGHVILSDLYAPLNHLHDDRYALINHYHNIIHQEQGSVDVVANLNGTNGSTSLIDTGTYVKQIFRFNNDFTANMLRLLDLETIEQISILNYDTQEELFSTDNIEGKNVQYCSLLNDDIVYIDKITFEAGISYELRIKYSVNSFNIYDLATPFMCDGTAIIDPDTYSVRYTYNGIEHTENSKTISVLFLNSSYSELKTDNGRIVAIDSNHAVNDLLGFIDSKAPKDRIIDDTSEQHFRIWTDKVSGDLNVGNNNWSGTGNPGGYNIKNANSLEFNVSPYEYGRIYVNNYYVAPEWYIDFPAGWNSQGRGIRVYSGEIAYFPNGVFNDIDGMRFSKRKVYFGGIDHFIRWDLTNNTEYKDVNYIKIGQDTYSSPQKGGISLFLFAQDSYSNSSSQAAGNIYLRAGQYGYGGNIYIGYGNNNKVSIGDNTVDPEERLVVHQTLMSEGRRVAIEVITSEKTLDKTNEYIYVDATSAVFSVILPDVTSGSWNGQRYHIKHKSGSSNYVDVVDNDLNQIIRLNPGDKCTVIYSTSEGWIVW